MPPQPSPSDNNTGSNMAAALVRGSRICILGGGFGGLYCALALSRQLQRVGLRADITLVEPRERFVFTPLLYEPLTRELKPWEVAPSYRELLQHTSVQICQDRVLRVDLASACCYLEARGSLTYDYLVVALGSRQRPAVITDNPTDRPTEAYVFTSLEDLLRLDDRLAEFEASSQRQLRITIVGAGPSGVELACKLADRLGNRGDITLLDRRTVILRSYPAAIQQAAQKALHSRAVKVYTSVSLNSITANQVYCSWQGKAQQIETNLLIWTIGSAPQPWPGQAAIPLTERQQYQVRPTLQLPDINNVFLLGDMAAMPAKRSATAPTTAQAAFQAAPIVAHNIVALMGGRPLRTFQYNHLGDMLTLGQQEAVVHGFGLCLTGRIGGWARLGAYWLRLPTWTHRWRVLRARTGGKARFSPR